MDQEWRGPVRSWGVLAGVGLLAWVQPFGCGGETAAVSLDPDVAAVLADVGPKVVQPALDRFTTASAALKTAVDAWKAAVDGGGDVETTRSAAQAAWYDALDVWEELEMMQIGPAASSLGDVPGGQDLRDLIYAWPSVSACRVDEQTVGDDWQDDAFYVARNVNVIGLAALETLLFSADGETSCTDLPEGWEALGADVVVRRAAYAAEVAAHVDATGNTLRTAWDAAGGDFAGTLARAGEADGLYLTQGEALDALFDALFYLDTRTKERKIARPLGLRDCAGQSCTAEVESTLAEASDDWIRANLRGFRAMFTGGDGQGLDDLLVARGATDVRDDVLAALDAADAAAAAITEPVEVAVTEQPDAMQALYDAVDALDFSLKSGVAATLSLQIPAEAAGDND